jgi:hypothetical protein
MRVSRSYCPKEKKGVEDQLETELTQRRAYIMRASEAMTLMFGKAEEFRDHFAGRVVLQEEVWG